MSYTKRTSVSYISDLPLCLLFFNTFVYILHIDDISFTYFTLLSFIPSDEVFDYPVWMDESQIRSTHKSLPETRSYSITIVNDVFHLWIYSHRMVLSETQEGVHVRLFNKASVGRCITKSLGPKKVDTETVSDLGVSENKSQLLVFVSLIFSVLVKNTEVENKNKDPMYTSCTPK